MFNGIITFVHFRAPQDLRPPIELNEAAGPKEAGNQPGISCVIARRPRNIA
jgi:hypothetical protein